MWQMARTMVVAVTLCFPLSVWAEDEGLKPSPQGPGPAALPETATPDIVGYRPIPESMLPIDGETPATQADVANQANLPLPTNLGGPPMTQGPYTLGPDDVVHIAVSGQPDFSGTYVVGPDGAIQYGLVGDIPASGITKEDLQDLLAEQLKAFVRVPSVHVTIVGFNSKAIYILGAVARPGKYAMRGDSIKIRDALIAAGLVTSDAKLKKVHIIKADMEHPTLRVLNLKAVLYKGKMKNNIDLVEGDIVVVPTTFWSKVNAFVSGLVSPANRARNVASVAAL